MISSPGSAHRSLGAGALLLKESKLLPEHLVSIETLQVVQERGVRGDFERIAPAVLFLRLVVIDGFRFDTRTRRRRGNQGPLGLPPSRGLSPGSLQGAGFQGMTLGGVEADLVTLQGNTKS